MKSKRLPFVGIDDFAFKKRMTYGTIFVDLITKKPIDLLDTRKQEDVTAWLKSHSNITLITRDGSKTYAKAVTEASPSIIQVGDRWHILHQLFEAVKKTIHGVVPVSRLMWHNQPLSIMPRECRHPRRKRVGYKMRKRDGKEFNMFSVYMNRAIP